MMNDITGRADNYKYHDRVHLVTTLIIQKMDMRHNNYYDSLIDDGQIYLNMTNSPHTNFSCHIFQYF